MKCNKLYKPLNFKLFKNDVKNTAVILIIPIVVILIPILILMTFFSINKKKSRFEINSISHNVNSVTIKNGDEITSMEQFIESKQNGYLLITDKFTGNHLHTTDCPYINEKNFQTKVIDNKNKFGRYRWFEDVYTAKISYYTLNFCKRCI